MRDRGDGYKEQKPEHDDKAKKDWLEDRAQSQWRSGLRANQRAKKAERREFRQQANMKARNYGDDGTR